MQPLRASVVAMLAVLGCAGTGGASGTAAEPTTGATESTGAAQSDEADSATSSEGEAGGTTEIGTTSGSEGSSSGETGEVCPPPPDAAPPWLAEYQDEIVSKLAGNQELAPGVVLAERSTAAHRLAAAQWLVERLDELGLDGQMHAYGPDGNNVFATLAPTEEGAPFLVVGAHYDSVPGGPGANDNATGVAMVLALARHLVEIPCRRRGVVFALFDQEEIGLVGSDAFAALLVDQGLDVEAVHTIDQMGWDMDGDRAIELERADAGLFEFWAAANESLAEPIPLHETQTGATDHVSFRNWGFLAVGLTEEYVNGDTTPHYHLPSDTVDTVDFDYLASTTTLAMVAFGDAIAAR